ncbi:hypothetical protein [Ruminococcus sp.]|uniref:hypothetical protein n=1 Tax=Ruminococcus sp. TaxID=41978 RepID=UPI0025F572B6|nr:hypothetical protein [Ruminococcus sp.]MBQ8966010.1 hypothetical protein [Ruminococcus sp.]
MDSGKISVRRFLLNIGLLGIVLALVNTLYVYSRNRLLTEVEGTIVSYEESTVTYQERDGSLRDDEVRWPVAEYTFDGETCTATAYKAKGKSYEQVQNMKIGDKAIFYTSSGRSLDVPVSYAPTGVAAAVSLLIVLLCCKAFKGYKTDFIRRYPKSIVTTLLFQPADLAALFSLFFSENLSSYILSMAALILSAVTLAIVWTAAFIRFRAKHRDNGAQV